MSDGLELVPKPLQDDLSYRQLEALRRHYRQYYEWLKESGKDPNRNVGYAETSVRGKIYRSAQFHDWVWNVQNKYTTQITHKHAGEYERALDRDEERRYDGKPYCENSKRKLQQAVVTYFEFRSDRLGGSPWDPNLRFCQTEYEQADYITLDEREKLYEATLTYDDLGRYNDLSPTERDRRKQYLAQKLGKPKSKITPEDFRDCRTSWKIPSLISVSLDIGARPVFVQRARMDWYTPEQDSLKIPKRESAKNEAYWNPTLSSRSVQLLNRWIPQREAVPEYDSDLRIWLNREGNPYDSGSLNYLLDNLIEEAEIDRTNRKLTWTSIRRSTGTYLTYVRSLGFAKEQLRHKSLQSTLRYVEIPVEARQDALDQLEGGHSVGSKAHQITTGGQTPAVLEDHNES